MLSPNSTAKRPIRSLDARRHRRAPSARDGAPECKLIDGHDRFKACEESARRPTSRMFRAKASEDDDNGLAPIVASKQVKVAPFVSVLEAPTPVTRRRLSASW